MTDLPIPALEMRELVGRTDAAAFDNANGDLVYPYLSGSTYEASGSSATSASTRITRGPSALHPVSMALRAFALTNGLILAPAFHVAVLRPIELAAWRLCSTPRAR
jgi:hypothetical protein